MTVVRVAAFAGSGLLLVALAACSGEDERPTGGASGMSGATVNGAGGATAGAGGTAAGGASMASAGGLGGTPTGGAPSGSASGGSSALICPTTGEKLPTGACYIPCTYNSGAPPRYESPAGNCTRIGWRCSAYQYCDPNIHCTTDLPCQTLGGPGVTCIPLGPLEGECLIRCNSNADCPSSNGATPSPYVCQAIDTGAGVIHVCGF